MKINYSNLFRAAVCAASVIAITACNTMEKPAVHDFSPVDDTQAITAAKEVSAAPMSLSTQIEYSRKDLAKRLGIEPDSIKLSGARPVNWRSGALGCPEPGMSYTQALTPGALIFLKAGNEVYAYHANQGGKSSYCPRERVEQPVFGQGEDML